MVFGRVWSFLKRHRRKFVFAGVCVAGVVFLSRYARRRLREYQEKEATECLSHIRRQHHFDSNQRTCNTTVLSMLPCLREAICLKLKTEQLTDQLRTKPVNKLEIWEELKVLSFTRTFTAVYGCCLLVVYLRVQLNILGGYLYLDSQTSSSETAETTSSSSNTSSITSDVQRRYLAGVQYLFEQGLDHLISDVHTATKNVLNRYSLKSQVSTVTLCEIINEVRAQVECRRENGYHDDNPLNFARYMMPMDGGSGEACAMADEDVVVAKLNHETRDMIESSDFHTVTSVCLDSGFKRFVDKVAEYFSPADSASEVTSVIEALPLAKVIPIVNGIVHNILSDAPNPFLQDLLLREQVKDFAANVYEAFSHSNDRKCSIY